MADDEQVKLLKKNVGTLKRDNTHLKEKVKVLDKRLDMLQDESAKIAVEMQSLIQSVSYIFEIALEIAKKEGIRQDMGLPPPPGQNQPGPIPPGTAGPPGVS